MSHGSAHTSSSSKAPTPISCRIVHKLLCRDRLKLCEQWRNEMTDVRKETDSLGEVDVAADKLWGAQTQRSLEHFSVGKDLIPREMITAYATLKKTDAYANQ